VPESRFSSDSKFVLRVDRIGIDPPSDYARPPESSRCIGWFGRRLPTDNPSAPFIRSLTVCFVLTRHYGAAVKWIATPVSSERMTTAAVG
jgi:hypothetical protein